MSDSPDDPPEQRDTGALEIREMELEDLSTVFHLGERLFTADVPNLYRTWDEYEVTEYFQSEPELALVADLDGQVVGFAMGTIYEKRRSSWSYGHLVWLGVDPVTGRRGVGTRLLREIRARMLKLGVRMLLVDTESDNDEALAFFAKHGFGNPNKHVYLSLNLSALRAKAGARVAATNGAAKASGGAPRIATRRPPGPSAKRAARLPSGQKVVPRDTEEDPA